MPTDLLEPAPSVTLKPPTSPPIDLLAPKAASPSPAASAPVTPTPAATVAVTPQQPIATQQPVDLLAPKPLPTVADIRQQRLDEAAKIPATPSAPDANNLEFEPFPGNPGYLRRNPLYTPPTPRFLRVPKEDYETALHSERANANPDLRGAAAIGRDGPDYVVSERLHNAIMADKAANPAPEAPQSVATDLKNVPANVGAGIARGIGGLVGTAGAMVESAGQPLKADAYAPQNLDAAGNLKQPTALMQAGKVAQRQGDYITEGATKTEQDLPVKGAAGKALVGVGELGMDAAMMPLAGPAGFTASFAARATGTMYAQSRSLGDDPQTAAGKGLIAGFSAVLVPKLSHVLPINVAEDIAIQSAKAYINTGSMVYAQGLANELALKSGTKLDLDLAGLFPEALLQGPVGIAMHAGGHLMQKARGGVAETPQPAAPQEVPSAPPEKAVEQPPRPPEQPTVAQNTPNTSSVSENTPNVSTPPAPIDLLAPKAAEPPPPPEGAKPIAPPVPEGAKPIDLLAPKSSAESAITSQEAPDANQPPLVSPSEATPPAPAEAPKEVAGLVEGDAPREQSNPVAPESPDNPPPRAPEQPAEPAEQGKGELTDQSPEMQAYHGGDPHPLMRWLEAHDPKWTELRNRQDAAHGLTQQHATQELHAHLDGIVDTIERGDTYAPEARNRPENGQPEHQGTEGGGLPAETGGGDRTPQLEARKQAPKSKAAIERALLDHFNAHEGDALHTQKLQDEAATENTGGAAQTFHGKYPKELRNQFTPAEFQKLTQRKILRLTSDATKSGGEDAMSEKGMGIDKYTGMLRRQLGDTKAGRLRTAVEFAKKAPDPEMRKLAGKWEKLDSITSEKADKAAGNRAKEDTLDDANKRFYKENLAGAANKQTIAEDVALTGAQLGYSAKRVLADLVKAGRNEADATRAVKYSFDRAGKPIDLPEPPKFFDPAAEGIKTGEGKGIFGQTTFEPATGKKQGGLFHEPVEVKPTAAENAKDAKIRGKFKEGEAATGQIFGNRTDAFGGTIEKEPPAAKAERKPITKNAVRDGIFGKDSFIGADVVPLAKEGAKAVHEAARQLQATFAPQTRGEQAKLMQGIAREHGATLAQRSDRAMEKLKDARKAFEGNKPEKNYDFIDKMENGDKQDTPQLTDAARRIREMLDGRRREVQKLGKGKLEHFIQDYFPHIWEDPEAAAKTFAQILGKRPLEGSKGFLKKRSIDTFSEGIKAGLKPLSDNPVDLVLLKLREMDRYILGQKMLAEMKQKGLAKFVPAMEQRPDGYTKIDDKIAQVYGPPTVKVEEHVDKAQHDALTQVMDNLGIKHERTTESLGRPKGGGKILGLATEGDKSIKTKFASGMSVMAHEIGHQLDYRYNLTDKLLTTIGEAEGAGIHSPTRPPGRFIVKPQSEFDALSNLRFTNVEKKPSKAYREYNGSTREQMAQVLEAYIHAPDRMREVAPRVFQAFSDFIRSRPELAPLVDARSSLSHTELKNEVAHGGLLKMGEYYAPDAAAGVINNYLSPGLRQKSGLFRAYLGAANVMNQAQLGMSAFHVGFTSMDAMTSKLALGIEQAVEGKPLEALKSLAATPTAPITNIIKGSKLLREWVKAGSEGADIAQLVNGLRAAGGRAKQDNFYRTNMADKMIKAFKRGNIIGGALRLPAGVLDLVAKPVMEYIVPRQKLGVFADLAQKELAKLGPDANHDDVRRALGQAWDSVDNRMGQVVYDNLFWKKAVKDISMASVRSLGWNLGTFRELGGGAADFAKAGAQALQFKKPEFTHRMAYTLAMPALAGMIGGTLHYLMTGKRPDDLKDYFFPKTGDTDANGHDVRLSLPSYMKDVYAYSHAPLDTLAHKLHPAIATTIEMLQNKDFYSTKIANEDDPLMKRMIDRAKYVAGQFIPFGIQGYQKLDEEGAPMSKKLLPFVGITQAPASVSLTKAEQVAQDLMRERMPVGSRTQAEADRTKTKTDLVKEMKAGKPGAADRAREMVRKGELDVEDLKSMLKRSKQSPLVAHLDHLDAEDALRVWAVASPKERQEIRQQMLMKVTRAQRMPADQKSKARQAIMKGEDVKLAG